MNGSLKATLAIPGKELLVLEPAGLHGTLLLSVERVDTDSAALTTTSITKRSD